jgi:predicted ArsR family transcriptional regulator
LFLDLLYYFPHFDIISLGGDKFMSKTRLDARFFESTRGQIILLLRKSEMTVNDLAEKLDLTDNAVRAHLLSLERDGFVALKGSVKGFRKPHFIYGLTENTRELFPRPYGLLFNKLLSALRSTLSPAALIDRFREVGSGIGKENKIEENAALDQKIERALSAIESLGGAATHVSSDGKTVISSESCPFAEAVAEHPEVCKITESMIAEILGSEVTEHCDRTSAPKCRFQVERA